MLKYCFLLFTLSVFSQTDSLLLAKKDSIYNTRAIRFYADQVFSTTVYRDFNTNVVMGSASARSLKFNFQVGTGNVINIGRRAKNLRLVLKDDPEAIAELNRAYTVHLRKKRVNNTLEYVSYFAAFGCIVPLFLGIDRDENNRVNALSVAGGTGVIAGWVGIYYFKNRTDKHMDAFSVSLQRSVQIYNANLLKK